MDALPPDSSLEYHGLGFRECSAEVARYLVAVEGLDLQDPLRLRLLSHLQSYAAQHRASWASWGAGGAGTYAGYPSVFQGHHSMLTPPPHHAPPPNRAAPHRAACPHQTKTPN